MNAWPRPIRLALLLALAASATACVSLLPKAKDATLYRFGATTREAPVDPARTVGVLKTVGTFQRGSGGDRLMTVRGATVAYIAETRWAAPASALWDEALARAFDAGPGPVRLLARGETGVPQLVLRLDVRNFEARYDRGAKSPPDVVIVAHATLVRTKDRTLAAERTFQANARASENRVSAIVEAYDRATSQTLSEVVAWTNATAGEL